MSASTCFGALRSRFRSLWTPSDWYGPEPRYPALVVPAELAVAVAVGVLGEVLQVQPQQGHAGPLELLVEPGQLFEQLARPRLRQPLTQPWNRRQLLLTPL
jgi:hypothetical protein